MKTYKLTCNITVSLYTEVEAENLEQAISIAEDKDLMSIVSNGGDNKENSWILDELDGTPFDIKES